MLLHPSLIMRNVETNKEGGIRVCCDTVLRYFWCGSAVIFVLTRGIAVITTINSRFSVKKKNVCGDNTL